MEIKHRYTGKVIFIGDKSNLQEANLQEANLWGANLQGADLQEADLWGANLQGANLWGANLWAADLRGANLQGADLQGADLRGANLRRANLQGTCIDPNNKPNAQISDFLEKEGEFVFGYRTRATSAAGKLLVDDRIYGCEVFSTDDTECHPGWYLWPTKQQAINFSDNVEIIKVKSRIIDMHKARSKWRSRTIHVMGKA